MVEDRRHTTAQCAAEPVRGILRDSAEQGSPAGANPGWERFAELLTMPLDKQLLIMPGKPQKGGARARNLVSSAGEGGGWARLEGSTQNERQ